jgi:Domain of unknown function (DUF1918)
MARGSWRSDGGRLPPGTRVTLRTEPDRHGTVAVVLHDDDHDHFLVRWDDGDVGDLVEGALVRE